MTPTPCKSLSELGTVLLVSRGGMLAAALAVGLAASGWRVTRPAAAEPAADEPAADERTPDESADDLPDRLVLVTDGAGNLPAPSALRPRLGGARIVVAARTELPALRQALAGSADYAITADQPFLDLVRHLVELLRLPVAQASTTALVDRLAVRQAEAHRFAALTSRERQVLLALAAGRPAAAIAAQERLALPTVRSHIRAVLGKLGADSQLAAVALTLRSCADPQLLDDLRTIHQF